MLEALLNRCRKTREELLEELEGLEESTPKRFRKKALLILAALAALYDDAERSGGAIREVYREELSKAADDVAGQYKAAGHMPPITVWDRADDVAAEQLTDALNADLTNAVQHAYKTTRETIDEAISEALRGKAMHGQTVARAKNNLVNLLRERGIQAYEYRRADGTVGYIQLDAYAETVVKSMETTIHNTAMLRYADKIGSDLVRVSSHFGSCPVCAPYQGRVYSRSGEDERFPYLYGIPWSREYNNFHPRCRHRLEIYVEAFHTDEENAEMMEYSNRSFEVGAEGWTDAQVKAYNRSIAAYNKGQAQKVRLYQDKKQWERYRAVLGSENVPGTLAGFRRAKGGEKWPELQAEYRRINRENAIIEAAQTPGGRHSGKYANAASWSDKSVAKAAKSYAAQVAKHIDKIANPAKYDKGWGGKTLEQKEGLLRKWKKDLDRNDELRVIMERILKERGVRK